MALHSVDPQEEWISWVEELQNICDTLFWDPQSGGYYFTEPDPTLIFRKKEFHDGALPSGNSIALLNLLRLGRVSQAEKLFCAMSGAITRTPAGHLQTLVALFDYLNPSRLVCTPEGCPLP